MIKIDDAGLRFMQANGSALTSETKEDLSIRIEVSEGLEKKRIKSNDELDEEIHDLFGEFGIQSTNEDIARIKNNIVQRRMIKLMGDIGDCTRIIRYQTSGGYKEKLEAAQEEFDRLQADPNSFFERLFDQKSKQ